MEKFFLVCALVVAIVLLILRALLFYWAVKKETPAEEKKPDSAPKPIKASDSPDELTEVADVVIDTSGGHKYVLLKVSNGTVSKLVVRADKNAEWHRDMVGALKRKFPHLSITCPGGGYINVDPATKRIRLDRQSGDYGRADHKVSAAIIKKSLPEFEIITN